jgi:oxalate decarboxylase/phosphoglucose isomerase-like protein (cupin superfamily)
MAVHSQGRRACDRFQHWTGGAITANFHAGDIGYITKAFGHYLENTGNTDLVYMEVFRADRFEEVSLSDWLAHSRSTWCPRP